MSKVTLSRERGTIIKCDAEECLATHYTALIRATPTRADAAKLSWSRGGDGFKRADFCPAHKGHEPRWFVAKSERIAEAKATRAATREAKKLAKKAA